MDWLAAVFSVAAGRDPDAVFELTTRDDPAQVRAALDPDGQLGKRLQITPSAPDAVQRVLQGQMTSVMFFTDGLGKQGSSPTRMAEILGCGLPVVANDGVRDVARITSDYRVGVLAQGSDPRAMSTTWYELLALLKDPDLASRCRKAAEEVFSLEAGTASYARLYHHLTDGDRVCVD